MLCWKLGKIVLLDFQFMIKVQKFELAVWAWSSSHLRINLVPTKDSWCLALSQGQINHICLPCVKSYITQGVSPNLWTSWNFNFQTITSSCELSTCQPMISLRSGFFASFSLKSLLDVAAAVFVWTGPANIAPGLFGCVHRSMKLGKPVSFGDSRCSKVAMSHRAKVAIWQVDDLTSISHFCHYMSKFQSSYEDSPSETFCT